jgi:hypothetical protein
VLSISRPLLWRRLYGRGRRLSLHLLVPRSFRERLVADAERIELKDLWVATLLGLLGKALASVPVLLEGYSGFFLRSQVLAEPLSCPRRCPVRADPTAGRSLGVARGREEPVHALRVPEVGSPATKAYDGCDPRGGLTGGTDAVASDISTPPLRHERFAEVEVGPLRVAGEGVPFAIRETPVSAQLFFERPVGFLKARERFPRLSWLDTGSSSAGETGELLYIFLSPHRRAVQLLGALSDLSELADARGGLVDLLCD